MLHTRGTQEVMGLPPQTGAILGRFDGSRHPLLFELNQVLDSHGEEHRQEYYDPAVKGDPFYLSGDIAVYAERLTEAGEHEIAIEVLDEGTRWSETQIHGMNYLRVAMEAAKHKKADLALALAIDNDRILAGNGPRHFEEVLDDEYRDVRMVDFASCWLNAASIVYDSIRMSRTVPQAELLRAFFSKTDLYIHVLQQQAPEGELPKRSISPGQTNFTLIRLGAVCKRLLQAGELERANHLKNIDPQIDANTHRFIG